MPINCALQNVYEAFKITSFSSEAEILYYFATFIVTEEQILKFRLDLSGLKPQKCKLCNAKCVTCGPLISCKQVLHLRLNELARC